MKNLSNDYNFHMHVCGRLKGILERYFIGNFVILGYSANHLKPETRKIVNPDNFKFRKTRTFARFYFAVLVQNLDFYKYKHHPDHVVTLR